MRSRLALAVGPLLFAAILLAQVPGLGPEAHRLLAVFAWTAAYWVTEALPLPVTALLSSTLCILLGIAPARTVLAAYGDPIIFLFIGSFVLAEATKTTGLDRRVAFAVLRRPWASRTSGRLLLSVGIVTCVMSLWLSNTATTALMLPVSTPPNAIVYGSRLVPLRAMVRSGICLDLAGAVVIWLGLRILCPLLGIL